MRELVKDSPEPSTGNGFAAGTMAAPGSVGVGGNSGSTKSTASPALPTRSLLQYGTSPVGAALPPASPSSTWRNLYWLVRWLG